MKKTERCSVLLKDLKFNIDNPRKISKDKMNDLKKSITTLGNFKDIVIDEANKIWAGNSRCRAMIEMGIEVPISASRIIGYTQKEKKAISVKDNTHEGSWDFDKLDSWGEDLKEYDFMGSEFNFDKVKEIEGEDDIPEVDKTTVKLGDLYKIGKHRLLCGDCAKKECFDSLLKDNKIGMVFTDPPYGVAIGDKNKLLDTIQKARRIKNNIRNDNISEKELYRMLVSAFINVKMFSNDLCSYFVTAPQGGGLGMMMMMMQEAGLSVKHVIIWVKNKQCFSFGRLDYEYKHEPILYTWNKKHKFYGKGKYKSSIWNIDKENKCDKHPTMKPVELVENALLNNSKINDLVLDCFGGSGTTLIACEKQNRVCYGMEIDEHYCQVIIDRYKQFTGKDDVELIENIYDRKNK